MAQDNFDSLTVTGRAIASTDVGVFRQYGQRTDLPVSRASANHQIIVSIGRHHRIFSDESNCH
ncbi:MAG: hypothetical protein PXZ08_04885 [Actinomycetota bacterium]|jgi:hypothetical protein|nr:hypothetical protein [Actinomycetota bacterium]